MTFTWNIDFGQALVAASFLGGIFVFIWRARGWFDTQQEEMKKRHRQNTSRLDFMLTLINDDRCSRGLKELPCPFRRIVDP